MDAVIPTPAAIADGYKFAVGGALIGVALSGVSEALGDWLVEMAGIEENSGEAVHVAANALIRLTVSTTGFLVADRLLRSMGAATNDPTGGLFFHAGYLFGQRPLVMAFSELSGITSEQVKSLLGLPCCASCAMGQACAGGR